MGTEVLGGEGQTVRMRARMAAVGGTLAGRLAAAGQGQRRSQPV